MFFFSKTDSLLGIDIGTSSIKAAQVKKNQDQNFFLENYGKVAVLYPDKPTVKFDPVAQTAHILKSLCVQARFTTKRAVVSLPSSLAFVSVLDFPPISEKEMEKSVEYQAQKYIPLPLTDVNLGWQIIEQATEQKAAGSGEGGSMKVLLTAVSKTIVNNYLSVISRAGLDAVALEIESLSLIRSLVSSTERGSVLIVDIGAKATVLTVVHERSLWATRHLSVGGDAVTASIAHGLGVSFERAEEMKRAVSADQAGSPALQLARGVLATIAQELQQVMRMFESQGKKIGKIILIGGGSQLPGVEQLLAAPGVSVTAGNPLQHISYPMSIEQHLVKLRPQLGVAVGLATRSSGAS